MEIGFLEILLKYFEAFPNLELSIHTYNICSIFSKFVYQISKNV